MYTNVLVGAHFAHDSNLGSALAFGRESYQATDKSVADYGLVAHQNKLASSASLYERKMVMLASALAHTPQALLLDEPVSGLNATEAQSILDKISEIRQRGTTVVIIEHVMRMLMAIADRLVILNRGTLLFDGSPEAARANEQVQRLYLGSTNSVPQPQ